MVYRSSRIGQNCWSVSGNSFLDVGKPCCMTGARSEHSRLAAAAAAILSQVMACKSISQVFHDFHELARMGCRPGGLVDPYGGGSHMLLDLVSVWWQHWW